MANAIRSGALAVDAFTKSLNENDETIMKAMWDTADAPEKWQLLTQQFQTAIEPLAGAVFDSLGQIMPSIMQIFESITPVISQLSEVLAPVITYIAQFVSILISELSPVLLELAQTLFPSLMTVIKI